MTTQPTCPTGQMAIRANEEKTVNEKTYYIPKALKEDLETVIATLSDIDKFGKEMGHRNILLTGPPGTGKTLGARFIAYKTGFVYYDGKKLSSAFDIIKVFDELRKQVKEGKKAILMLDEIDRFSSREESNDPGQVQMLNQLLAELDGVESNNGIFVIGMTNMPNRIDPALRRPGRFGKEIEFMPPDEQGRLEILKIHANGKGGHQFKFDPKDVEYLASVTYGYTGGDLRGLLDEAMARANLRNSLNVKREDLDFAKVRIKPSAIRDMPFKEPKITVDDIGGYALHKDLLGQIVSSKQGGNILFYGPPGVGKTTFAEALAKQYGLNLIVVSGSAPLDKYVGETGKKLEKYFDRARQLAPCVLLFDGFDALIERRGFVSWASDWTGLIESKLSSPMDGVYVIATTEKPELIGPTLLEKFRHRVYFPMPQAEEVAEIWARYLPDGISPETIKDANPRLNGLDIARVMGMIKDFGIEPTTEILTQLVTGIEHATDLEQPSLTFRDANGDSIQDYRKIKALLGGQNGA